MACAIPKLDKAAVRKMMIRRRNDLILDEVVDFSREIEENLFSCEDFLIRDSVLYYLSFGKEVHTDAMIARSLKLGIKVFVPRVVEAENKLEICEIKSLETDFHINGFGIREPSGVTAASPTKIDAIVTPGLAFDSSGGRIGFGGGYYDRLFMELPVNSLRLGVAYDFQIMGSLHQDVWDKKVQKVFTEKDTLNC
ncbi:MAG TPA: 5-formyltetrahydrofolate cyclo-ligase [Nitrospinae bacterium]|jgi:5-formyltetrahydrofolate cyclo-ligase|nr:5-formyltetrahydrofolate cyclo-ligase [Nitrospinota bacterium]